MSLETIVKNMVTAKEPEANIAKVIKHYNQINKSPLKQTEEVVTEEVVETPDCEAEGMVWSEAEQKCVPKQEMPEAIELTPNTATSTESLEIQTPEVPKTRQETVNLEEPKEPDLNAWQAQAAAVYEEPKEGEEEYYKTQFSPFAGSDKDHKKNMNDLHQRITNGLQNSEAIKILTGGYDDLSIVNTYPEIRDKILAQVKKEFPKGYKTIKPEELDQLVYNAIDVQLNKNQKQYYDTKRTEAFGNKDLEEIINIEMGNLINNLSKSDQGIYQLHQIIKDPNTSPEEKNIALEKINKIAEAQKNWKNLFQGESYTQFIDPYTGSHLSPEEIKKQKDQGIDLVDISDEVTAYGNELNEQKLGYPQLQSLLNDNLLTSASLKEFGKQTGNYIINNKTIQKFLNDAGYSSSMDNEGNMIYENVPFSEISKWGSLLTDNLINKIAAGTDVEGVGEIKRIKPNGEIVDIDAEELLQFNNENAQLYARQKVLKDLVLLNKLPETSGFGKYIEKPGQIFREGLGVDLARNQSFTERATKDLLGTVLPEAGLELGEREEEELKVGFGEALAEGAGGATAFLVQLAAIDKFNPLKMQKWAKLVNKWSKSKSVLERTYAGLLRDGMEEIKFQLAGGQGGEGYAFSRASRLIPSFGSVMKGKYGYNQAKTALDLTHGGTAMVAGGQASQQARAILDDIANKKEFQTFLDQNYPDWDTAEKALLKEFILGAGLRGMHLKKRDLYTSSQLKKTGRIAKEKAENAERELVEMKLNEGYKQLGREQYKTEGEVRANNKRKKELEEIIQRNQEIAADVEARLYNLNNTGAPITEEFVEKALETQGMKRGTDVDVTIVKDKDAADYGLTDGTKGEYRNNGKEIVLLESAGRETLLHELNHYKAFKRFNEGGMQVKQEFIPVLKEIYEKIETGEGKNLWSEIQALRKKENWKDDQYYKELLAYGTEYLNKPENYRELVANNIFKLAKNELADFVQSKFGFNLFNNKPVRNKDVIRMFTEFGKGDLRMFDILAEGIAKPSTKNNELIGETVPLQAKDLKNLKSANERTRRVLDMVGKSPEFLDIIEGRKTITIDGKKIGQKEVFELISDKIARTATRFGPKKVNLNDFKKFNLEDYVAETMASILPDIKKFDNTRNTSWNNQLGAIIKPRINRSVKKAWGIEGESIQEKAERGWDVIDPTENIGETMSLSRGSAVSKEIISEGSNKLNAEFETLKNTIENISGTSIKNTLSKELTKFTKNQGSEIVNNLKTKFKGKNFSDYITKNPAEALSIFLSNNKFKKGQNRDIWDNLTEREFVDYMTKGEGLSPELTSRQRSNAMASRKTSFINAFAKQLINEKLGRLDMANQAGQILQSKIGGEKNTKLEELKKVYKEVSGKSITNTDITNLVEFFLNGKKIPANLQKAAEYVLIPEAKVRSLSGKTNSEGISKVIKNANDIMVAEGYGKMPEWGYKTTKDFSGNKSDKELFTKNAEILFKDFIGKIPEGKLNTLIKQLFTGEYSTFGSKDAKRDSKYWNTIKESLNSEGKSMSPELSKEWNKFIKNYSNLDGVYSYKYWNAARNAVINGLTPNTIKELQSAFNSKSTKGLIKLNELFQRSLNEYVNNPQVKRGSKEWKDRLSTVSRILINNGYIGNKGFRPLGNPKWIRIPKKGEPLVRDKVEHLKSMNEFSTRLWNGIYNNSFKKIKDFDVVYGSKEAFDLVDSEGRTNTSGLYRFANYKPIAEQIYDISTMGNPGGPKNLWETLLSKTSKDIGLTKQLEEYVKNTENTFKYNKKEGVAFGLKEKDFNNIESNPGFLEKIIANAKVDYTIDRLQSRDLALEKEFNSILEESKGVKAEAVYSEGRARKLGKGKGRYKFFVPYSAEDFLGLTYATLGKGKQGEAHQKWYQDNLIDPYNKGITEFEVAKQGAMRDWRYLKGQIKNTPSNLKKKAVRDFTNEEALRVYMWEKNGVTPEGLSKKDVAALVKHVNSSPELKSFAEQIASITKGEGYPMPEGDWLAGTITTDLVNHINTASRAQYLQNWQRNVDAIYTPNTMNKLRATFGDSYVESLQDALYRMKTGRNRPTGANKLVNGWLNWVNDSVGTVMFLNQRSALLQTISSVNYMNWTDNNPLKAAQAFANQKQFWKDFSFLFNSDYLKQRRSGLKTDVNADEIASSAATSPNKARAAASWILKQGFLPTQIADSFAISMGGASFYRNRLNKYKKEGLSEKEAQEKAFQDFRQISETSQQSSDPSKISMQQAGPLGRLVLAFANTPMQYTRLTKRAAQDLINGRGDWKTNVSKIGYYGAVQNMIFAGLQQAMFGIALDPIDEDDDTKLAEFKQERKDTSLGRIANSTADTFLRGSGVGGAFVSSIKNLVLEANRQAGKKRPDYERVADKFFTFSPVVDSKFKKLQSAGRTFTYKQELQKIHERGVAVDNPALMAVSQVLSAYANIPLDRAIRKINNVKSATEEETQLWQKIALLMGYGEWELGISARKTDEARAKAKKEKEEAKKFKNLQKDIDKEDKKKSPIKALQHGVLGRANKDGTIEIAPGLPPEKRKEVERHEELHQLELQNGKNAFTDGGKLDYSDKFVYYGKKKFARKNGMIAHAGKWKKEGDHSLPWEKFAHKHDNNTKIA